MMEVVPERITERNHNQVTSMLHISKGWLSLVIVRRDSSRILEGDADRGIHEASLRI